MLVIAILAIVLVFFVKCAAWFVIDVKNWIPSFINYMPYACSFCCAFWINIISQSLLSTINLGFLVGVGVTVLDAVAYLIDRRKNTVELENNDINLDENE